MGCSMILNDWVLGGFFFFWKQLSLFGGTK